jgi:hypothetical protein
MRSVCNYAELRISVFRTARLSADDSRIAVLNTAFRLFSGYKRAFVRSLAADVVAHAESLCFCTKLLPMPAARADQQICPECAFKRS